MKYRAELDPEGAAWEWRCIGGEIQGRPLGGDWSVVGPPGLGTIIDGRYIGARTVKRMALWLDLQARPVEGTP